jgi:hypothetical protein
MYVMYILPVREVALIQATSSEVTIVARNGYVLFKISFLPFPTLCLSIPQHSAGQSSVHWWRN